MINILYSFIGCFFALRLQKLITNTAKDKAIQKRIVPKNIGRFADPLGDYEPYKDENNLYKSYIPTKNIRRGDKDE